MAVFFIFCISAIANLVTNSDGQLVTLTPPPGSFYCDMESITCSGNGDVILWTAPPLILHPQGFFFDDAMQQTSVRFGNITITLTNVEPGTPPFLISKLTLSNISEVYVTCQTDVPGSLNEKKLIRSETPPPVENLRFFYVNCTSSAITWTIRPGNYDIKHFIVQVHFNDTLMQHISTINTSVVVNTSSSGGKSIRVSVEVMNRCGQVGMSMESNLNVIYPISTGMPSDSDNTDPSAAIDLGRGLGLGLGVCLAVLLVTGLLVVWIAIWKHKQTACKDPAPVPSKPDPDGHIEMGVQT